MYEPDIEIDDAGETSNSKRISKEKLRVQLIYWVCKNFAIIIRLLFLITTIGKCTQEKWIMYMMLKLSFYTYTL